MDYAMVYAKFIADRRLREPALEPGTYDVHHIVPRCRRGTNHPTNLLRLTFSDHLFAHVLLAKVYGGLLLTCAVRMSGMKKYRGRRARASYSHLRQQLARSMRGNRRCEGRPNKPETTEKKRAAWTPEMRERQRLRMMGNSYGSNQTPEMRERLSQAQQRRYARERAEGKRK